MKNSSGEEISEQALVEAIKDELYYLKQESIEIDDKTLEMVAQKFGIDITEVRKASYQL